jgi:hypothetical protein
MSNRENLTFIYCDESCHLENDHQPNMVLGAIACEATQVRGVHVQLREIKKKHGLSPSLDVKWNKVSPAKLEFHLNVQGLFVYYCDYLGKGCGKDCPVG